MRSSDYLASQAFIAEAMISQASDALDILMIDSELGQLLLLREQLPAQKALSPLQDELKRCNKERQSCGRCSQGYSPRQQGNPHTHAVHGYQDETQVSSFIHCCCISTGVHHQMSLACL